MRQFFRVFYQIHNVPHFHQEFIDKLLVGNLTLTVQDLMHETPKSLMQQVESARKHTEGDGHIFVGDTEPGTSAEYSFPTPAWEPLGTDKSWDWSSLFGMSNRRTIYLTGQGNLEAVTIEFPNKDYKVRFEFDDDWCYAITFIENGVAWGPRVIFNTNTVVYLDYYHDGDLVARLFATQSEPAFFYDNITLSGEDEDGNVSCTFTQNKIYATAF